jgi:hypothetical protein
MGRRQQSLSESSCLLHESRTNIIVRMDLHPLSRKEPRLPGNTRRLATGTSARLRAGHDVCRAPGSAARWGRAGRKLADARGRCDLLRGR